MSDAPFEAPTESLKISPDGQMSTLVDLGFGVTSTRKPTLDEVARSLDFAYWRLEARIKDSIRFGCGKDQYETDVFDLAALERAQKLVRLVALCEPAVTATIKTEIARLKAREQAELQDEEERKAKARYWAQRRLEERKSENKAAS
jgi:hypothetical protein